MLWCIYDKTDIINYVYVFDSANCLVEFRTILMIRVILILTIVSLVIHLIELGVDLYPYL